MPKIKPVYYPSENAVLDRVRYIPGRKLHVLEYQEERIDPKGNIEWISVDRILLDNKLSVKAFNGVIRNWYDVKSHLPWIKSCKF